MAAGVEPWDRVAIMKANHPDVLDLSLASARLGAIPAHLAWTLAPEVAQTLLKRLDRPVLVTDRKRLQSCGLDDQNLATLTKRTIVLDADEEGDSGLNQFQGAAVPSPAPRRPNEPMAITHTSGTTGIPKLVVHSAQTVGTWSRYERRRVPVIRISSDDTVAFCDPYFHARLLTGLVGIAENGPKLVLMSDPDPATARGVLSAHRPTMMSTVPNVFLYWEPLAEDPSEPFVNVRLFFNTYDAIHVRTVRKFLHASRRKLPVWVQAWGQSETGPVAIGVYTRRSASRRDRQTSLTQPGGWPVALETRLRAVDPETGQALPHGRPGLLEVRRQACLDYVGERERYLRKRRKQWWNTGDLGVVTWLGTVRVIDREVDRIDGGSCIETEDRLLDRLEQVTEAIVLSVQGEHPVAIVSTVSGEPPEEEAWQAATGDLPKLAGPIVICWHDFPRTATWKVERHKLRAWLLPETAKTGSGYWT